MKNRYFCAMDHSIPSDLWSRSNCFWKGPIPKRPGLIGQSKSMDNAAHAFEVGRVATPWNESHEHCDIVDKPHSATPAKVMRSTHQGLQDYNHSSCAIIRSPGSHRTYATCGRSATKASLVSPEDAKTSGALKTADVVDPSGLPR